MRDGRRAPRQVRFAAGVTLAGTSCKVPAAANQVAPSTAMTTHLCSRPGRHPAAGLTRRQALRRSATLAGLALSGSLDRLFGNTAELADTPVAARSLGPSLPVAIERCSSYEPALLRQKLDHALDLIGGIGPLVSGKTVTIKLNLTGGPGTLGGLPAYRTYHVHPNLVAALCAALHDAGAARIVLVESGYKSDPLDVAMARATGGWPGWDIGMIAEAGGHTVSWEDTRNRGAWADYVRFDVPWGGTIYPAYLLNRRYHDTDVLISLAKLKEHACAGITLTVKNQFGIAPSSIYGNNLDSRNRPIINEGCLTARNSTFHDGSRMPPSGVPQELDPGSPRNWPYRVPRIVAELWSVRPADLCLIDGIETNRGGEGPWNEGVAPIQPHLLLAGRNGVCTDAIGTMCMGFSPTAGHTQKPFKGANHFTLLAERGYGTNRVSEIEVRGLPLEQAVHPFDPAWTDHAVWAVH